MEKKLNLHWEEAVIEQTGFKEAGGDGPGWGRECSRLKTEPVGPRPTENGKLESEEAVNACSPRWAV